MAAGEPLDLFTELESLLRALPDWGRAIGATLDHVFGAAPATDFTFVEPASAGPVDLFLLICSYRPGGRNDSALLGR